MCYIWIMRSVASSELGPNITEYLRLVESGEQVEVTENGKAIARLVAVPAVRAKEDRPHAGRAMQELLKRFPPLPPVEGQPLPSQVLAEMRADER